MKIINKVLPIFLILFIYGCSITEAQTSEIRTFSGIDGIVLLGSGNVDIVHGNKEEVIVHAPADLVPYLLTEVKDGTLLIGKRKKGWKKSIRLNDNVHYEVTVKSIDHVKISGSGNLDADKLTGNNTNIKISGSGNIDIEKVNGTQVYTTVSGSGDINIDDLKSNVLGVTINGSGDIEIDGSVSELDVTISGSGDFNGDDLNADDASIDVYGSGDAVFGCNDTLKANITGSGDVVYHGNPSVNTKTKGSGDVRHR